MREPPNSFLPGLPTKSSSLQLRRAVRGQCLKDQRRARGRQLTQFEPTVRRATDACERLRRAVPMDLSETQKRAESTA